MEKMTSNYQEGESLAYIIAILKDQQRKGTGR